MTAVRKSYTQEEMDTALLTYWVEGRNADRAALSLDMPAGTLLNWVHKHRERLEQLIERNQPVLDKAILARVEAQQIASLEAIGLAIEQATSQLASGPVKNPDQMAQRLATVMGILTDKSLILQGRPNQITEASDANVHMKRLRSRFPWMFTDGGLTDGTAEEVEQPQIEA